jgi:hypothetical protein
MSETPANWYPDGQGHLRWWDGSAWTEQVKPIETPESVAAEVEEAKERENGLFVEKDGEIVAKGYNGQVHFDGSFMTIARKGVLARASVGKGEKRIHISHISSVQLKPAGPIMNGFISFSLSGGNEKSSRFGSQTADAVKDENSVVLLRKHTPGMERMRAAIENAIASLHDPSSTRGAADPLDQISKLGTLRDQGLITDAEFSAKKAQILGL